MHTRGLCPQIRTWPRFLYNTPTCKFHHPMLVIRKLPCWQTNKQTPLKTSNTVRYATTSGKYLSLSELWCSSLCVLIAGKVIRPMLVTVVRLMYEAVEWLWKWRSGVRCMRLIYENLSRSSVILRQTADNAVPYNELASVTGDGIHVVSAVRVLWTYRSRQLAVLPSQVELAYIDWLHR